MLHLLTQEKDIWYQIGYWVTAFLPVILGFGITMIIIVVLTKKYKGPDDDFDEFKNEK